MRFSILIGAVAAFSATASLANTLTWQDIELRSGTEVSGDIADNASFFDTRTDHYDLSNGENFDSLASSGNEVRYRADPKTGAVGTFSRTGDIFERPSASSTARILDTLSFDFGSDTSGTISYSIDFDASASLSLGNDGYIQGGTFLKISDVTGKSASFEGLFGTEEGSSPSGIWVNSREYVVDDGANFAVHHENRRNLLSEFYVNQFDELFLANSDTSSFSMTRTIEGQFEAFSGRTYAMLLGSSTLVTDAQNSVMDSYGSSYLSFSADPSATIYSASGALPGTTSATSVAPVPLPAGGVLLFSALGALAFARRKAAYWKNIG